MSQYAPLAGFRSRMNADTTPAAVPNTGLVAATVALLLAGSAARADDSQSFSGAKLAAADPLAEVVVTAGRYKGDRLSLSRYAEPLLTTGQSATIVTTQLMEDEGVTSLRDSLRNVSGISIGAGEGSYQGDNFSIRGFAARSDVYLDGMSDFGNYNRDPFNTEEVEVLKGPSSAEFGRGAAGGAINMESKTPQLKPLTAMSLEYGSDVTRRATVDIDRPLEGLAGAAVRVNAMVDKAEIADRPGPFYSRWGVAPSLSLGIDTATRLTLSYFFQHQNDNPDFGIPWILDRPAPVSRTNFYGFTDGSNFYRTNINIGTLHFEHDFNDHVTVREQLRLSNYHRELQISQGDPPDDLTPATPLNTLFVDRTQIDGVSTDRAVDEDLSLRVRFKTGALAHSLIAGIEYLRQTVDPKRVEPCWSNVPQTSLLYPTPNDPFTGVATATCTVVDGRVENDSAYLIDTMKLGEQWIFTGAMRVDRISSYYSQSYPPPISFRAENTLPSFRGSVVYQPDRNGSVYLSAGTSVHPNVQQFSVSSETALDPSITALAVGRNVEVEIGTKWQFIEQRLLVNAAIFWDQQTNPAPVDLDDPLNFVTGGKERVRGLEFGLAGAITTKWNLSLNYTYQDGIVTASSDPTLIGNQVLNAPKSTTSLWTTYDIVPRVQVGVGLNQVSTRTASESPDPINGLIMEAPGYVIGSAMAKYRASDALSVQLNVTNLTNKYYFDGVHPGHVVPGPGRAGYLILNYKF